MELYNNKLCLSTQELTDGIVTLSSLKQMSHRGRIVQVRRACNGTCALWEVESLPMALRAEVYRRWPDLKEQAESKPFVEAVETDGAALAYFADYVLSDGRHLAIDKQNEYANNCAILNAFGLMLERANSHRLRQSRGKVKVQEYWEKAAAALPRLSDRLPNSLPQSGRRLQARYADYRKNGYESMISAKFQNRNAAKVADETQEALLTRLLSHHNNLDNADIALYYNNVARTQGWDEITASAVAVWREKTDLITAAGRRGATNFRNEKSMQVKRSRPSAAFLYWTLDGWDCELLYQATTTDRNGHRVTTYTNRLCLEVVLDPCCNYPIGYAIGTHETPELIREALRNAARHTEELTGEMLRVDQLQCDRYAIKTMTELYRVAADKVTPARAHNAKAKVIEPYFKYLNKTYCQKMGNWSGYGITSDPTKQPNSEALNLNRHSFPDEAGLREQIKAFMNIERQRKHDEFMGFIARLPGEKRLPLSREQYLLNFGASTGYVNAIEGTGLRPTLMGVKRDYDCWDLTFRTHAGTKWRVMYDPENMADVLAVNEDGSLQYMLSEKYVQPMALADRREGDAEELAKVREFNQRLEEHVTDRLAEAYGKVDRLITGNPQLENVLGRLLICDSRGQHKLPKARKRLEQAGGDDANEDYDLF